MHDQPADQNASLPSNLPTDRRAMLAGLGGLAAGALLTGKATAGPLNPPPGPIAPTMKPLDQVEPRIAVNQANTPGNASSVFRITQPGSYYLASNIIGEAGKSGVSIESDNVTLDLNGFAVIGLAGALNGLRTNVARNNIAVRNGTVSDWPNTGIFLISTGINALIEGVIVRNNGGTGMSVCSNAIVRGCIAENNSFSGISLSANGVVAACAARNNGSSGIATGINSSVFNCSVRFNGSSGINAGNGSVVQGCSAGDSGTHGILVNLQSVVIGNSCRNNGVTGTGAGIRVGSNNRVEDNHCANNVGGIEAAQTGNFIARNTCRSNSSLNYSIPSGNVCLVVAATTSGAISGNSGGTSPGSTNPNANYAY